MPRESRGIVAIQCTAANGETGTFLFERGEDGERLPISPIFASLAYLFPWLNVNGWRAVANSKEPTGEYERTGVEHDKR